MSQDKDQLPVRLPLWEELPTFSLHLDQLLTLTNQYLEPIIGDQLTKTMLHNYFKAKILLPLVNKRYERIQLAGAIVVGLLKNIFSLTEIQHGLAAILEDGSPKYGYNNFVRLFNEQAAQAGAPLTKPRPLPIKSAKPVTVMQYDAVQSILFWLSARKRLAQLRPRHAHDS